MNTLRHLLRNHAGLAVLLLVYLIVASLYGVLIPIFETPDAGGHYAYIHELTEGRGLPVQGTASGERVTGYVTSHPPLYYTLCAIATFWVPDDVDFADWAWYNPHHAMGEPGASANKNLLIHTEDEAFPWRSTPLTAHVARLISTILCGLAVVAAYGTTLELFPDRRRIAWGAAALTALNPMFVFTAARVSNDAAVAGFGGLVVWAGVRLAVRGLSRRGLIWAGAALGLAALSKLSGVTLAPALAVALLLSALRDVQYSVRSLFQKGPLTRLVIAGLILFGTTAAVCGWWFVRNLVLYDELMGVDAWLSHTATVRPEPIGFLDVIPQLEGLEMSYWALFGWFNIFAAPWMYRFWWVLVRLAAVGLILILVDQFTKRRVARPVQAGLSVLAFAFLLILGSVWRFIMIVLGSQGRYFMPVAAAISILLMLGLSRLLPRRWTPSLALLLGLGHLAIALICLFAFILPTYAPPEIVAQSDLPRDMVSFDLTFDGTPIQLLGGDIENDGAHPGDLLPVSLYWRALESPTEDLFAYAKILGRDSEPIAGVDGYPGRGNLPLTLWEPGVIYRDRYLIPLAADAEAPTILSLHAGLRREGELIPASFASGDPAPEAVILDLARLRPGEPVSEETDYPVGARIGEAITLAGYDISSDEIAAGDTFTVTVVWRADAAVEKDYTVFVHLLDEGGELAAQDDHPPLMGEYRTSFWVAGDVVRDTYRLTLAEDHPPCTCTLLVGMYDPEADARVPAYDGLGRQFENDAVVVGGVNTE